MALSQKIVGTHYHHPDYYLVEREKVREYANAVHNSDAAFFHDEAAAELGYKGLVSPLTFVSIIAVMTQRHFFQHVDVGFETMQIVQVDQKFNFLRPIVEGDILRATMHIDSVVERFGADIVTSRNVLHDEKTGEVVMEAFTTLMGHEGDNSISAGWDPETGQVLRKPVARD